MREYFEWTFFLIRLYGALISFAAAFVIWKYGALVQNPRFTSFVKKFWVLMILLGVQRSISLYYIDFFFTFNNITMVLVTATISTWIFGSVLWRDYLPLRRKRDAAIHQTSDPRTMADNAMDMLDYHVNNGH